MIDLVTLARPWTATDAERPSDPVLPSSRVEDVMARVSIVATRPAQLLRCWDSLSGPLDVGACLAAAGVSIERCEIALSPVSKRPIESGYLECMRLAPAPEGVVIAEAIEGFTQLQLERYPDMEAYLRKHYGKLTPTREADPRFRVIDYPAFDLGGIGLGFGLFVEQAWNGAPAIWCWSRVVNWHK